jgi:deoxycytidine triphosphate deaminase
MLIVGDNLKALIEQYTIVDQGDACFDETSISLRLDHLVTTINPPDGTVLTYGESIPSAYVHESHIATDQGVIVGAHSTLLACSFERVRIPLGYFGMLQTKGSLARLFVTLHCCDGQIDPGFDGKITFEICNHAPFGVRLRPRQRVGDLFIFKASTRRVKPYSGRYQGAKKPTIQLPEM